MKTTIEISDAVLAEARRQAAREGTTLRALVEEGLRRVLDAHRRAEAPFVPRRVTYRGEGLHPDLADGDWARIRERIYEGHGG